jgi:phage terminase small subunit
MGVRGKKSALEQEVDTFVSTHAPKRSKRNAVAPAHLGRDGSAFYTSMRSAHDIRDPAQLATLVVACEALDLMAAVRATMKKEGVLIVNQYDISKAHPGVQILKESRAGFLAAMRLLALDGARSKGQEAEPWED